MPDPVLTIGAGGIGGTGKSSSLNALFGTQLPTSPTTAATRDFRTAVASAGPRSVRLIDAPGLGEDDCRDQAVLAEFARVLPGCDLVLWVLTGRDRTLGRDLGYLEKLAVPVDRLVFGVNQVDLVEPADWNPWLGLPSEAQEQNILELVEDRRARLATHLGEARPMVGYSATRRFRLQELFTHLVAVCPKDRVRFLRAAKTLPPAPQARLDREAARQRTQHKRERELTRQA
jgi:uncharacterized protein